MDYLGSLSYEQILPHVYLNYMAIMFGGQMMKKAVPSTGRMYVFDKYAGSHTVYTGMFRRMNGLTR